MPEQKIVITIDDEGAITAKTKGFMGESCLEALVELLDLDGAVSDVKKTDEYHQQQTLRNTRQQSIKGRS